MGIGFWKRSLSRLKYFNMTLIFVEWLITCLNYRKPLTT